MGSSSSNQNDSSQLNRNKMLVEYLNGLNRRQVKEITASSDKSNWYDILEQYEEGDCIIAPDGTEIKLINKTEPENIVLECLNCGVRVNKTQIEAHFNSSLHLDSLF